jgi:type I restriction enzyme S subunit
MDEAMLAQHYPLASDLLPSGWTIRPLGELVSDARSGYSSGKHNSDGVGVPHLRPMNIDRSGQLSLSQIKYVAAEASDLRLRPGDIVFNNTNSRDHVGKSAIFDILDADWGFSNHITRIRLQEGLLPKFVAYQLLYLWDSGYFHFHAKQHVNQASISTHTLTTRVPLLVAPLAQQQELIDRIERVWLILDSVGEAVGRAVRQLARYQDRTILDAAAGRLVPSEAALATEQHRSYISGPELLGRINQQVADQAGTLFNPRSRRTYNRAPVETTNPVDENLPTGWVQARVDEVGEVTLGKKREPSSHAGPYMRPYLRVANVLEDRIDVTDVLELNIPPDEYEIYRLEHGDLLLNEGQSPELVGRSAMYRGELPGGCFQMTLLRFRARAGVSATFALLVFRAYLRLGKFRDAARWSTNIAHLSTRRFAAMPFPLPPLEEQERIVEEASRRLAAAESLAEAFALIERRIALARNVSLRSIFPGASTPMNLSSLESVDTDVDRPAEDADKMVRRTRATGRSGVRAPLLQVLTEANTSLKPEELFDGSGYSEELVDEFYSELRQHVVAGTIVETRDTNGEPLLMVAGGSDEA